MARQLPANEPLARAEPVPQIEARTETPPVKSNTNPLATGRTRGKSPAAKPGGRAAKTDRSGPTKLFVLDTNVLMHDPMCLYRFEEHDIFLPMIVLEELDSNKKGMTEVARNARQTSRSLDALAGHSGARR